MDIKIPQKNLTAADKFILFSVVLITVVSFIIILTPSPNYVTAHIITDDSSIDVSLKEDADYEIESNGYNYTVRVLDGEISVINATCPDGICRNTPAVGKKKGSIVCLPGKMIIECNDTGGDENGADVVVP